ncbi:MAG: thioredoxin family protein [Anaerolineaceae bacterium]
MEKLLDAKVQSQIRTLFTELKDPVEIIFFGNKENCEYCQEIEQLLGEVVEFSDKLHLTVYDFDKNKVERERYNVNDSPVFIITGKDNTQVIDYGIRFYGMPGGHEFASFVNDLVLVSGRDSGLEPETRAFLAGLQKPLRLQVFVTPTCPYCPQAVILAHQMAMESKLVTADMVEATEFPELAERFNVSGVPQTTINLGAGTVIGAYPEFQLVEEIKIALARQQVNPL